MLVVLSAGVVALFACGATPDPKLQRGQEVYAQTCASCHGAQLEGQPNWRSELAGGGRPAPPHDKTGHTWHHPDAYLFGVTKFGGQRFSPPGYANLMPAFGDQLSDDDISAVIAYIKSTWPAEQRNFQSQQR